MYRDEHGKLNCACGKKKCRHCCRVRSHATAIRKVTAEGVPSEDGIAPRDNGKRIENECGTSEAKSLQDKLNGNNGTVEHTGVAFGEPCDSSESHPSQHNPLDVSNPFEESEQLDIDQIEGRSNGDLAHKLSNGKWVISYNGIMSLASKNGVTFTRHTIKSDAKRDGTVIAHARRGNNTRASGKPMNGSFITAVELAKRNAARQLLSLVDIKILEKKAQLESEFDWQVAKRKCLDVVPGYTLSIIIDDMVSDGTLAKSHVSNYDRSAWLLIYNRCREDAKTNGNDDDDDGAGNTASSPDRFTECRDAAKDFVRYSWLKDDMLKEGILSGDWTDDDFTKLKEACEIDKSLFGRKLGTYRIEKEFNTNRPYIFQRRYTFHLIPMKARRQCFHCGNTEGILRDRLVRWERYEFKTSLCQTACDPTNEELTQKFDQLYKCEGVAPPSEPDTELPDNVDDFIAKCKELESEVDDPAPMVEWSTQAKPRLRRVSPAQMGSDEKRKLQMDKKLKTWLVEADGTKKAISCREICEQFDGNIVMQLRSGIDSGGDISTVELDN